MLIQVSSTIAFSLHILVVRLPLDLVHAGLWESATQTADSLSARIAIIHLVAEARGIDMNPLTLAKLQAAGDVESSKVLEIIHADEITREFLSVL